MTRLLALIFAPVLAVGLVGTSEMVFAQQAAAKSTKAKRAVKPEKKEEPELKEFAVDINIKAETDLRESSDPEKVSTMNYVFGPTYNIDRDWALTAQLSINQELTNDKRTGLDIIPIGVQYRLSMGDHLQFNPRAYILFPGSDIPGQDKPFIGTRIAPRLNFALGPVGGYFEPSYTRLEYEFLTSENGKPNVPNIYTAALVLGGELGAGFSLAGAAAVKSASTYRGSSSSSFSFEEILSYKIHDRASLNLGHSNGGSTLKANRVDSNIAIFDPYSSTVYFEVALNF